MKRCATHGEAASCRFGQEQWVKVRLGDLFTFGNGYTPSKSIKEYWEGGTIPWFRMEDIRANGRILKDSIQHVTPQAVKKSGLFPAGSFILSTTATIGEYALLIADSLANQQFTFLIKNVNRKFEIDTMYFLQYLAVISRWCRRTANAGGLLALSVEDLKNYRFQIPPLAEQRKIAKILSAQDRVIELKERLLEEAKSRKKALVRMLMEPTGKKRLEAASPCGADKCGEAASSRFVDGWSVARMSDLFVPVTRKNTDCNANILTISAQDGLVNQFEYYKHQYASVDVSGYTLLTKGEFAYNKSRSGEYPYGAIKMLNKYDTGVVSPLYLCFSAKDGTCLDFWSHYFESGMLNRALYRIAQEGARNHGLLNIPTEEFFDSEIHIPPLAEQRRIAAILSAADREIDLLRRNLEQEKRKKKALMQLLLTGIVRVPVDKAGKRQDAASPQG